MRLTGDWLNPYSNQTYDGSDCDSTDQGIICSLRTGYCNLCLTEGVGVCQWDHSIPTDILFEVGPHTLCVTTMNPHSRLPYFPFFGCLQNVYIWTWHNKTYWLTNQISIVVNSVLLKCRKLRREDQETSDSIVGFFIEKPQCDGRLQSSKISFKSFLQGIFIGRIGGGTFTG